MASTSIRLERSVTISKPLSFYFPLSHAHARRQLPDKSAACATVDPTTIEQHRTIRFGPIGCPGVVGSAHDAGSILTSRQKTFTLRHSHHIPNYRRWRNSPAAPNMLRFDGAVFDRSRVRARDRQKVAGKMTGETGRRLFIVRDNSAKIRRKLRHFHVKSTSTARNFHTEQRGAVQTSGKEKKKKEKKKKGRRRRWRHLTTALWTFQSADVKELTKQKQKHFKHSPKTTILKFYKWHFK